MIAAAAGAITAVTGSRSAIHSSRPEVPADLVSFTARLKPSPFKTAPMRQVLEQAEVYGDADQHRHGLSVFGSGFEAIAADGFEGFLVETHTQCANDVHILRNAVRVDNDRQHAGPLIFIAARIVGELGFRSDE